ncbi:4008_t:CDS:2 [Ambispora leptoticha]|uniref:4008_t:CDS:1 n=1 Tax=Ambispora leptoticha TaxID=144679 RepID=A0A9N9GHA7_9GLOM|nr:4008_t:CDS:2 [Ambispora leptoticha]
MQPLCIDTKVNETSNRLNLNVNVSIPIPFHANVSDDRETPNTKHKKYKNTVATGYVLHTLQFAAVVYHFSNKDAYVWASTTILSTLDIGLSFAKSDVHKLEESFLFKLDHANDVDYKRWWKQAEEKKQAGEKPLNQEE